SLGSPLQRQGRGTIAVVEAVVGSKVLHIRLPGGGDRVRVQVHIVLLLGYIALNVEDELLARLQVFGASLQLQHGREGGVIDVTRVPRGVRGIGAIQPAIRFPGDAGGTPHYALELALYGRGNERAEFLDLQLRVDADVFEEALHQLCVIDL